jgi:hypothetical protein
LRRKGGFQACAEVVFHVSGLFLAPGYLPLCLYSAVGGCSVMKGIFLRNIIVIFGKLKVNIFPVIFGKLKIIIF